MHGKYKCTSCRRQHAPLPKDNHETEGDQLMYDKRGNKIQPPTRIQIDRHKLRAERHTVSEFQQCAFQSQSHHKQPETNIFNHSPGHMPTGNHELCINCMFPFVSLRSRPPAAPWGFMTARIDPLHHHSVLTNGFKLAISGIMEPSEIQPSDALQQAGPRETQGEKNCSTVSLLKCRFPSFQNRMLSWGGSLVLSVHVCTAQTTLSDDAWDQLSPFLFV